MKVLVCGASGCIGSAVARALRSRGHQVVEAGRSFEDGPRSMALDFMQPQTPSAWAQRLQARGIEAVVNCVGILMPSRGQSFARVHSKGPIELFRGAALAGVARVVQVSALGVGAHAESLAMPYLHSKFLADEALATLPLQSAVLRPSLVYGPRSQSSALFATLASLPVIALPGRGEQPVQPVQVYEVAEAVARLLEQAGRLEGVLELGGGEVLSYREMLAHYRRAQGLLARRGALWLPVPMPLMQLGAWLAEALPQQVYCRDTLRLLALGSVPRVNALPRLLGRAATGLQQGLAVAPPVPAFSLQVQLGVPVAWALRAALAFMWLYTAAISALLPQASGVMALLARCGFEGQAGVLALTASCALNTALGLALLWRPSPVAHAAQCAAILGYTLTAALHMPELTIDHCAPLVKNLPVLMAVLLLWLDGQRAVLQAQAPCDYKRTGRLPAVALRALAHTELHQPSR
jgi:uncharacterized protein YbjT (DUF2867 family)